ncbi:hypothetical protein BSLG_003888 [Batrachochytrium salamandrivorans]|nr:hypothetical protein BASA81_011808 [Batrachochytrium salamandrivorans]KAJ1341459.1 hypothetical protein BSLG_003888 [Batrachochytrium salamandrivorans]
MQPHQPQVSSQKQPAHQPSVDMPASKPKGAVSIGDDDSASLLLLRKQQTPPQMHQSNALHVHVAHMQHMQLQSNQQSQSQSHSHSHPQPQPNGLSSVPITSHFTASSVQPSVTCLAGISASASTPVALLSAASGRLAIDTSATLTVATAMARKTAASTIQLQCHPVNHHHAQAISPNATNSNLERSHAYASATHGVYAGSTVRSTASQSTMHGTPTTGRSSGSRSALHTNTVCTPVSPEPISPFRLGFVGKLILRKPGSIAFFVELLKADRPVDKIVSPVSEYLDSLPLEITDSSPRSLFLPGSPSNGTTLAPPASSTTPISMGSNRTKATVNSEAVSDLKPSTTTRREVQCATHVSPQSHPHLLSAIPAQPLTQHQQEQQHIQAHPSPPHPLLQPIPAETAPPSSTLSTANTTPDTVITASDVLANKSTPPDSSFRFSHVLGSRLRLSPQELKARLNIRHDRASAVRNQLAEDRRSRLRRHAERVSYRILLQRQRDRLQSLQQQAKNEYTMTAASLKRQMILRRMQERLGAATEHAHSVMLMQKLRKFLDLRRAFSENFIDVIKESLPESYGSSTTTSSHDSPSREDRNASVNMEFRSIPDVHHSIVDADVMSGLRVTVPETDDTEYETKNAVQSFPETTSSSTLDSKPLSPAELTECNSSPVKPTHQRTQSNKKRNDSLMLDDEDRIYPEGALRKDTLLSIRKSRSMSSMLLVDADDFTYLELLNLLPPVTRFTLRELELDEILSNAQLRHDLVFDPDLQFKPNAESDQEDERAQKADAYWDEVSDEIAQGYKYRIPLLLAEVRAILIELLPNGQEIKDEIDANIDVKLMAQQIDHGVMNPLGLIEYLSGLMKVNCAPIRDQLVDTMVESCHQGDFVKTLRTCFDILELMKLDYANHQLTRLRPYVIEHQTEFEWKWFKTQYESGSAVLEVTKAWLKTAHETHKASMDSTTTPPAILPTTTASSIPPTVSIATDKSLSSDGRPIHTDIVNDAFLQLILQASRFSKKPIVPETLKMDVSRLVAFYNDWQDITILSSLLVLFRQAAGAKCTVARLEEAKNMLWVLLNDSDTTMSHISLQVAHTAGEIRGKPFTEKETEMVSSMMEKTLAPESKLYDLIQKRVGENLKVVMATGVSDKNMMAKHGLTQLDTEVVDLGIRIQKVAELNRAVFGGLYIALLDDIKAGAEGAQSPSALAVLTA